MPLTVTVRLRTGIYEAATDDPQVAEWPPHPARLFCALAASARDESDWDALRWLEGQPAPEVHAAPGETVRVTQAIGFVVTNEVASGAGSQTWPGRTNGQRLRASAIPPDGAFAVVWPGADPDAQTMARLNDLARRVPYLGRSTGAADVHVDAGEVPPSPGWARWVPARMGEGATMLSVPYGGYVEELRAAYERGARAWEVSRLRPYATSVEVEPPSPRPRSPFSDLLIFGFEQPVVPPGGQNLLAYTTALRAAVLSRVPDPVPPQVSGHGAEGRPHVAYLGLVHAGFPHSDGHLLGVGVAIPASLETAARRSLVGALIGTPLREVTLGSTRRKISVEYIPDRTSPYGLTPERWVAPAGAQRWVSATPLALDVFLKAHHVPTDQVARAVATAGYPEPTRVEVSPAPLIQGAVGRLRVGALTGSRPRRPFLHARIEFAEPVLGPVIAGSLRYLGAGLFVPQPGPL